MIEKLSTGEYAYDVQTVQTGVQIALHQTSTGKRKEFFLAGIRQTDGIIDHMNSLTDDLCSQWFNERVHKSKKEKKNA